MLNEYSNNYYVVPTPSCTLNGNRVVSLVRLKQYIYCLTEHAASCGVPISFLGESSRHGLATVFVSQCSKYHSIFRCDTSNMMTHNGESHYTTNDKQYLARLLLVEELNT